MKYFSRNSGIATLEMLIAMTLIIISLTGTLLITQGNQDSSTNSQVHQEALRKASDLLESMQAEAGEDFNLVNPIPAPPATYLQDGIYQKTISVTMVNNWTKKIIAAVSWKNADGKTESESLSSLITDPDAVASGSDSCNSTLAGNWQNPAITSYDVGKDLLVPSDTTNLFPVTGLAVNNNVLYATINNTHQNSNATFFMFDISNPNAKPVFLQSIDNDPTGGSSEGLAAVAVAGNYAYVANARQIDFSKACPGGDCGQLQIIDVSKNPASVVSTFQIPGVTGKSGQAIGASIFYQSGYVYLGLTKTASGPEFNIIDVHDPKNPVYKSGYDFGSAVNSIVVKNNIAYVTSPNAENLTLLDVSNPSLPQRIGGYTPKGGSNGESLAVVGTNIYLGRTFGTNEFYDLDASVPSNISVLASKDIGTGSTTSINSLLIRDYLAFLITNTQFQIWNLANLGNIVAWAPSATLPAGSQTALSCNANTLYASSVSSASKGYILVINAQP